MPSNKVVQITTYQDKLFALLDNGDMFWRKGIENCEWHKLDTLTEQTDYIPEGLEERATNVVSYTAP